MDDEEYREKNPGFTDASYITREEAPNMPRSFSSSDEKNKNGGSALIMAGLCIAVFVLGSVINTMCTSFYNGGIKAAASKSADSEAETISDNVMVSAQTEKDKAADPKNVEPGEKRPYLGVIVQTVSNAAAGYYNSAKENSVVPGVQVYAMDEGGPAAEAGVQCGDIITGMDGRKIESADDLTDFETECSPGENAVVTIYRDGEYVEIPVIFADSPGEDPEGAWYGSDETW